MKITILGLTITSSWGNGHATTFRSLCGALYARGHRIEFIEKNVAWYANHRDLPAPAYCQVSLYTDWFLEGQKLALRLAADADIVLIGSYFPDAIDATQLLLDQGRAPLAFYDIDTPITLAALRAEGRIEYLEASSIPSYDAYISFTGGPVLREIESRFGSPFAAPLYCSVDSSLYRKVAVDRTYSCDLSYLGTYAADRQPGLVKLLNQPAFLLPDQRFLVAGPMYPPGLLWPSNVLRLAHVPPDQHPAFYSSARFTLNVTRQAMLSTGYSPSVRLFEASACGATILSDISPGLETFLTPGEEILTVAKSEEVVDILTGLSDEERQRIGARARERVLASHTAEDRAREFEMIVNQLRKPTRRNLQHASSHASAV